METTVDAGRSKGWRIHDLVVGLLAGTGAGLVAAIFTVARLLDHRAVVVVGVALGAGLGLVLMERSGRDRDGVTLARILGWVVAAATFGFVALILLAIRDLQ